MAIDYPFNHCAKRKLENPYKGFLNKDIFLEQWQFVQGTEFKAFETKNFGYIVFGPEVVDKRGFKPARRIFRF